MRFRTGLYSFKPSGPSQTALRFEALAPRASGTMSKETFWPSVNERMPAASTAVACTNTSLPPPSGAIKPKPLEVLKNFTVPIVILNFLRGFPHRQNAGTDGRASVAGKEVCCLVQARTEGGQDSSTGALRL